MSFCLRVFNTGMGEVGEERSYDNSVYFRRAFFVIS